MSKDKFKKVRKAIMGICAVGLIVVLTVAGTLAYLSTTSNVVKNTFIATGGISLGLVEENYNIEVDNNGTLKFPAKPNPKNFHPGVTYDKDPILYNTTGTADGGLEWVALRIDYKIDSVAKTYAEMIADDTDSNTATIEGMIGSITFDKTNWIQIVEGKYTNYSSSYKFDIWVYKYPLKSSTTVNSGSGTSATSVAASTADINTERTTALFESITIKNQDKLEKNGYDMNSLPDFDIYIQGGAVKHDDGEFPFVSTKELVDSDVNPTTVNEEAKAKTSYKIKEALVDLLYDKTPTT